MTSHEKEYAYGCIIFNDIQSPTHVVLVHNDNGHIGFPKGHKEGNEEALSTVRREIKEETGISQLQIINCDPLQQYYRVTEPNRVYDKEVSFWVGVSSIQGDLSPELPDVIRAWWCPVDDVQKTVTYESAYILFQQAHEIIQYK